MTLQQLIDTLTALDNRHGNIDKDFPAKIRRIGFLADQLKDAIDLKDGGKNVQPDQH